MNFHYKARTAEGNEIQGIIDAPDERSAMNSLSNQGMFVTKVEVAGQSLNLQSEIPILSWIPSGVFNAFLIQMAVLIRSGVPLTESLSSLIGGETHPTFKRVLGDVLREVEQGRPFSSALGTHPEVFDHFFVGMIHVAETGGVLDIVLNRLAKINQRTISLRNQIINSLAYPTLLLIVTAIVLLLLFGYSLPRLAGIFIASRVPLPEPTQILLSISTFTSVHLRQLFGLLFGAIILAIITAVTSTGRWIAAEIGLRLPITGKIIQGYLVVQISEMLGLLLGAGVPLMELLVAIEGTMTMPTPRKMIENMRSYVGRGSTLRLSLEGNYIFPPMALKLIETGEKTGNLDKMFDEIANFYDENLQMVIKAALSTVEPVLLVFIAGIIAFIMLSVVMPIMRMSELIGAGPRK